MCVELVAMQQLLQTEVHTVAPEVARIGRHIDTLGLAVIQTQLAINSQPVLHGKDDPHSRAVHVLDEDSLSHLGCKLLRCLAGPAQLFVVVALGLLSVLEPPGTQRIGVVGACGADRQVGCIGRMGKETIGIFGHALNLQTEDMQIMHDLGHAGGHHTQVLATAEHTGGVDEGGQFAQGRVAPELCVAMEEIVVVDAHDDLALIVVEFAETVRLIDRDTRVQQFGMGLVAHEEHFGMQVQQTIYKIGGVLVGEVMAEEIVLYLALGVELVAEEIDIAIVGAEELLFGLLGIVTEYLAEEIAADIGFDHTVFVEFDTHIPQVLHRVGHSR